MQFALMIYESPEAFAMRENQDPDPYRGAWRAYYKSMLEAGIYLGGNPLELPGSGATVSIRNGTQNVQDGPYADTKEQLAGIIVLELPSRETALEWAARCPAAAVGSVEVRPIAPEVKRRIES